MNFLDYRGLFILTLLYYYQGLVIGFLFSGISILLAEKGVPYQKIGYLASAGLPFTLKFLWAPILDFYFIESLGKRKTYIIPCLFFVGLIYLYLAQSFNKILQEEAYSSLLIIFFVIMFLISTCDTAVDGWQITLLSEENLGLGSVSQSFGQSLGHLCGSYLLLLLNSTEFSLNFVNNGEGRPLVTIPEFLGFMGVFAIFLSLLLILIREINPNEVIYLQNVKAQYLIAKGIFQNKNLKQLSTIFIFLRIGFGIIESVTPIYLVKIGLSRETFGQLATINFICVIIVVILIGKFMLGRKKEIQFTLKAIKIQIFNIATLYFSILLYQYYRNIFTIIIIGLQFFISESVRRVYLINNFAFVTSITEGQIGAMTIAILISLLNISRTVIDPIMIFSLSFIPYPVLLLLSVIEEIWFVAKYEKSFLMLQNLDKSEWSFQNKEPSYVELQ